MICVPLFPSPWNSLIICLVQLGEEKIEDSLQHLEGGQWRKGGDLFSLVTRNRTQGKGMELHQAKFRLE